MKRTLGIVAGLILLSVLLSACNVPFWKDEFQPQRPSENAQQVKNELYVEKLRTASADGLTFSVWNVNYRYCVVVQNSDSGEVGGLYCNTDLWIVPDE